MTTTRTHARVRDKAHFVCHHFADDGGKDKDANNNITTHTHTKNGKQNKIIIITKKNNYKQNTHTKKRTN